jgi:hypothetical protein
MAGDPRGLHQALYRARRRVPMRSYWQRHAPLWARLMVLGDVAVGLARDAHESARAWTGTALKASPVRHVERAGQLPASEPAGPKWCLYAAYSPQSAVTAMVQAQLRAYRDAGYRVVFISMSDEIRPNDRTALRGLCSHIIQRHSRGRDFGAWADALRIVDGGVLAGLDCCQHLLLTNDSCLGPIRPLAPWITRAEARDGLVGLTESIGGGSHVQSYFLLANGRRTVSDVCAFLLQLRPSASKFLTVQRGEIALSARMREAGLPVSALIDHESIEHALLERRAYQAELELMRPHLFKGQLSLAVGNLPSSIQEEELKRRLAYNRLLLRNRLFSEPLNPCHQLLPLLLDVFAMPFVKADLVMRNPGHFPSVPDWRYALSSDSPVTEAMIDAHLATLT